MKTIRSLLLLCVFAASACSAAAPLRAPGPRGRPVVVVTTSMLECAVRDLLGPGSPVTIVRLVPPGSCPGHFDLSPGMLPTLRKAALILRHDYQAALDAKLRGLGIPEERIASIPSSQSFLIPWNYLRLLEQTARRLEQLIPDERDVLQRALQESRNRLNRLASWMRSRARDWQGAPVVAARFQAEFCRWLGFEVKAVFPRPEDMTPRELRKVLAAPAALVVGNLQSGGEAATALAERKGVPGAILSNFPDAPGYGKGYEGLLRANIERLAGAWAARQGR